MVQIDIDGQTLEVHPRVRIDWGPFEAEIAEALPAVEILKFERIALNAAWLRRSVQLEDIDDLEALLAETNHEGENP